MIDNLGLMRFLVQFSAGVSGALALWGFVFILTKRIELAKITRKLFLYFFFLFFILWSTTFLIFFSQIAYAHEGIFIKPFFEYIKNGFNFNLYPVMILALWNIIYRKSNLKYFFINLIGFFIILSFAVWKGIFDKEQGFFILHNIHSIFTLGTVVSVDILYILSLKKEEIKESLYSIFPFMSLIIWIGLGIDFISVFPIFPNSLILRPQFYFSQIVVAILILNGTMLSGRINEIIWNLNNLPKWKKELIHFSGAISITSWLAILFVDFFNLNINLGSMLLIYFILIVIAFLSHKFILRKLRILV